MIALPHIRKARLIRGHHLVFRDVDPGDAEFIVSLRADNDKNRFLAKPTLEEQRAWIAAYRLSEDQAYFIVADRGLRPLGTVRLYGAVGDSFSWGSWMIRSGAPASVALESALIVYRYATAHLRFTHAYFDVHPENVSVWRFHERFGAVREREDDRTIYYRLSGAAMSASMRRLERFLPAPIDVLAP
jgi:RimJ/RimL family protein N-acetyltransferase